MPKICAQNIVKINESVLGDYTLTLTNKYIFVTPNLEDVGLTRFARSSKYTSTNNDSVWVQVYFVSYLTIVFSLLMCPNFNPIVVT